MSKPTPTKLAHELKQAFNQENGRMKHIGWTYSTSNTMRIIHINGSKVIAEVTGGTEQDAHLIAAAPELLEACVGLIEYIGRAHPKLKDKILQNAHGELMKQAIAKAEGR